jgi:hypothetical protein
VINGYLECDECALQLACWSGALDLYGCNYCARVFVFNSKLIERACDSKDGSTKWVDWFDIIKCASFKYGDGYHDPSFKGFAATPGDMKRYKKKQWHGPPPVVCPYCNPLEHEGVPVREWSEDGETHEDYIFIDSHKRRFYGLS